MLRRLPRLLGAAGLRKAGCQPSAGAGVLRALQTAAGQGSASTADAPSPWLSVGKVSAVTASALLASQAAAEEAAPAPAAPPDPTSVLRGLKKLSDAKEVVLYQYATCPFCNKLRAFLDFHKIPYKVVEVNPLTKKELKWSTYTKVPVLTVDGEQLNDSSFIIKALSAKLEQTRNKVKLSGKAAAEEEEWFRWVDGRFVHVLTPNIYRTLSEAMQTFDYITKTGNFGFVDRELARWSGVAIMYTLSHTRLKKRHNIVNERESLYEEIGKWTSALGTKKFMGGDRPNLADIALFGVLRAVKDFDTFKDVLANTSLQPWFTNMEAAVGASSRLEA